MTEQIAPVDWDAVASRVRDARTRAGMTRDELAHATGVSDAHLSDIEQKRTPVGSELLLRVSAATHRSLAWFIEPPLTTVAERRVALIDDGSPEVDTPFDRMLEELGINVRYLVDRRLLCGTPRSTYPFPNDVTRAEHLAQRFRQDQDMPAGPLNDLTELCDRVGLFPFIMDFGADGNLGAMIEVTEAAGVALINGTGSSRRRRFTLAHELGHWITGSSYEAVSSSVSNSEKMLNTFAAHLLMPRDTVVRQWHYLEQTHDRKSAAVAITTRYGVSWSAALLHLKNLDLITPREHDAFSDETPAWYEFDISVKGEAPKLGSQHVSTAYTRAVLSAYSHRLVTRDRAVDMLLGTVDESALPIQMPPFRRGQGSPAGAHHQ